jgi:glycosyltransferase involved in cell wall biosynthesis
LDNNSGIHIFNLANQLTQLGVECIVCVPQQKEKVASVGNPLFEVVNIDDLRKEKTKRNIDLIHVWTPREIVRKITSDLLRLYACPYMIHLEDNEEFLIEAFTGFPSAVLRRFPSVLLDLLLKSKPGLSHPARYKEFLSRASGVTVIMDTLRKFCPENIPNEIIWAGYQEDLHWDAPVDIEFRHRLGIANNEFVVAYTGNVHKANQGEVTSLYQAIWLMNRRGYPVKLVRTGTDYVRFMDKNLSALRQKKCCIELGRIPRDQLPLLLSISDVLVQPGKSDQFNDYRFPSKLPEYLASGKPTILPKTNIGGYLKDKDECLLLEKGDADDIAQKLEFLFSNELLRKKIGSGGREFAQQHLKWGHIARKLYSFYNLFAE